MAAKKAKESPEAQSERFWAEVKRLMAAGELDPTEADKALDKMVRTSGDNRSNKSVT